MTRTAFAVVPPPEPPGGDPDLATLRRRLAGATAREAVVVDFLEDDLREAEAALAEATGWLDAVARAVRDPAAGRRDLAALVARDPAEHAEYLGATLAGVRHRLAQVAAGLGRVEGQR